MASEIKIKYGLNRDKQSYVTDTINDQEVRIVVNILAIKVGCKNCPNQCTSEVITCTEQCNEGLQMNWSLFFLNQLMEDVMLVQEGKRWFIYSWLFILISLVAWMDPVDYQGMDVEVSRVCKGARYQNL